MKERPILFSSEMVRAILENRKSQTRRIVNPNPDISGHWKEWTPERTDQWIRLCPYGVAGDRIWVRETFWVADVYSRGVYPSGADIEGPYIPQGSPLHYAADGNPPNVPNRSYPEGLRNGAFAAPDPYAIWLKRPSIHMPRWASRITLEITKVRCERLKEISQQDAKAEGCNPQSRGAFFDLWDSINGKGAWDKNPWVWVIEFQKQ